ncbi:MAG: DUF3445 domain-containing protein [Verrucomicrobiales bacterium]|nr:DUF3445 domain-containing protein [Verrucomicrobiales bacterium]
MPSSSSAPSPRLPDAEIFPLSDFRLQLKLARCPAEAYFGPWDPEGDVLAERRRWIESNPELHVVASEDARPALLELEECVASWAPHFPGAPHDLDARALAASLGTRLEPDFVVLVRDAGPPRVRAACVCFPSHWTPEDKLGATLARIHDAVPGLNEALGSSLDQFVARLRPGVAWLRANWGLTASPERNQHPSRGLPRLRLPVDASATWLRIEHQALVALPRTGAVVFGIRIEHRRLDAVAADPVVARGLARALRGLPTPLATYKGIESVRLAIADRLDPTGLETGV